MAHKSGRTDYASTPGHRNPIATARNKGQQGAAKRAAPKAPVFGIGPNRGGDYYAKGGKVAVKPKGRK